MQSKDRADRIRESLRVGELIRLVNLAASSRYASHETRRHCRDAVEGLAARWGRLRSEP